MSSLLKKFRTFLRVRFIKKYASDTEKYSDKEYNKKLYKLSFGKDGDFKNPKYEEVLKV